MTHHRCPRDPTDEQTQTPQVPTLRAAIPPRLSQRTPPALLLGTGGPARDQGGEPAALAGQVSQPIHASKALRERTTVNGSFRAVDSASFELCTLIVKIHRQPSD